MPKSKNGKLQDRIEPSCSKVVIDGQYFMQILFLCYVNSLYSLFSYNLISVICPYRSLLLKNEMHTLSWEHNLFLLLFHCSLRIWAANIVKAMNYGSWQSIFFQHWFKIDKFAGKNKQSSHEWPNIEQTAAAESE